MGTAKSIKRTVATLSSRRNISKNIFFSTFSMFCSHPRHRNSLPVVYFSFHLSVYSASWLAPLFRYSFSGSLDFCIHGGTKYRDGDYFPPNRTYIKTDGPLECVQCRCQHGLVVCEVRIYVPSVKRWVQVNGSNCRKCYRLKTVQLWIVTIPSNSRGFAACSVQVSKCHNLLRWSSGHLVTLTVFSGNVKSTQGPSDFIFSQTSSDSPPGKKLGVDCVSNGQ